MTNKNFDKFGNTKKYPVLLRKKPKFPRAPKVTPYSQINLNTKEEQLESINEIENLLNVAELHLSTVQEKIKEENKNEQENEQKQDQEHKKQQEDVNQNKNQQNQFNLHNQQINNFANYERRGSSLLRGSLLKKKKELFELQKKKENKTQLQTNRTETTISNPKVSDEKLTKNEPKLTNETQTELLIERKYWLANLMKTHPDVLEMRERTRSFTNLTSFGNLIKTGQTECKEQVSGNLLLEMIINFLKKKGCTKTVQSLHEESGINTKNHYSENDQLTNILGLAIKNVDYVWDSDINNCVQKSKIKHPETIDLNEKIDLLSEEGESLVNDLNIWDEPEDNEENFLPPQNKQDQYPFYAVTLNKLIEKITSISGMKPRFLYVFLMTYQSFTTPGKLLYKLFQRYDVPKTLLSKFPNEKEFENFTRIIQLKTINVLKNWIERHFLDFNQGFLDEIKKWIERETEKNSINDNLLNQIQSLIKSKGKKYTELINNINNTKEVPEPKIPKNIFSKSLTIYDIDDLEIARQISIIDSEYFSKIKPAELLNCAWSKEKLKNRATNVLALMDRFEKMKNQFSNLILKEDRVKSRVKIFNKIIKIAEHLSKLNNFHSLSSMLAAIDTPEIKRLKFTLNEIPHKYKEILQNLQHLMKEDSNYTNYREYLQTIISSGIPYLNLILNDLTLIDKQHPDFVKNNLINFQKRILIYDSIEIIQQFQHHDYLLHPVEQIRNLLTNMESRSQKELFAISQMREPKNAIRSEIKF
ncbi:guanine nucleotide exchange factor [Anaeramoeba flamelloides]|uniref:Guanine nucleotide exchange factor n=1 Tax=Anaeramoeba flamelloides TaxID=1746091 RepID=A0ABQ8XY15_9EUKA|nr:guanine nucleotide exchange factor [Anaeramoeba flamelloides]